MSFLSAVKKLKLEASEADDSTKYDTIAETGKIEV